MPTAHDFDQAAHAFDRAAEDAGTLLSGTRARLGHDVLRGGQLSLVTDLTLDTAERMSRQLAVDCAEHAATCRERANACRAYAADLSSYQRADRAWSRAANANAAAGLASPTNLSPRPRPPRRNYPWIEI